RQGLAVLPFGLVPVLPPGLPAGRIFGFTPFFQENLFAVHLLRPALNRTLPVGISVEMVRGDVYFWGPLMASAIIGSVPVVIVYALSLDWFISGMTTGAVK